jgi:hypothetical protein
MTLALLATLVAAGGKLVAGNGGAATVTPPPLPGSEPWTVAENRVIWTNSTHAGFPTIASWGGALYVGLREASAHAAFDGYACVIRSTDTTNWTSVLRTRPAGVNTDAEARSLLDDGTRLIFFSSWSTNSGAAWHGRTHTTTNGTSWTTNNAGIPAIGWQALKDGTNYYWTGATRTQPYSNGIWRSNSALTTWTLCAWISGNGTYQGSEAGTWIEDGVMYQHIRRDDAAGLAARVHDVAYAAAPYTSWTRKADQPWLIEGQYVRNCGAWGNVMVHRFRQVGNGPFGATYVAKVRRDADPWYKCNLTASAGSYGDTGYGDAVEHNGSLYVVYYAGPWAGKVNIWLARITR